MSTAPIVRVQNGVTQGAWTPPQWSKPAMVALTVPASASQLNVFPSGSTDVQSMGASLSQSSTLTTPALTYVFDAVLALEHEQSLVMTQHPVQNGAAISSHAYLNPATLCMYVLMSDVAASYSAGLNQTAPPYIQAWSGNPSKSVSAYTQVLALQASRVPLTITTRLRTYYNMIIARVSPREDDKTITGARFRVEFCQIFIANTQAVPVSARPNDTSATGLGGLTTQPPSAPTQSQFKVPPGASTNVFSAGTSTDLLQWLKNNPNGVQIPGAGTYSSANINSLQTIPSP